MAATYHVNGSAGLYIGQGLGSFLGFSSAQGVSIGIAAGISDIYSDEYGPFLPSEMQQLGTLATINFELWKYDASVLNNIMATREAANTPGGTSTIGTLMLNAGFYFGLSIASPIDNVPWYFPTCQIVADPVAAQLSTELKIYRMAIRAVKWSSSGSASAFLYRNSFS